MNKIIFTAISSFLSICLLQPANAYAGMAHGPYFSPWSLIIMLGVMVGLPIGFFLLCFFLGRLIGRLTNANMDYSSAKGKQDRQT